MLERFHVLPFLFGLGLGITIFFFLKPEAQEKVVKWPHPSNAGKLVYRDRNGLCYTYKQQIADCGSVKESLQEYSFQ